MEKFIESLEKAKKTIEKSDHLTYITCNIVKDKKLLLKILEEIKSSITDCLNALLQYEYIYKRIKLYKDPKSNFEIFENKCAQRYEITKEEINLIKEIFKLTAQHKQSAIEFIRREKVIILSDTMQQKTLTIEKIKQYLQISKKIYEKTNNKILRKV